MKYFFALIGFFLIINCLVRFSYADGPLPTPTVMVVWTSKNFKYLADAVRFENGLPNPSREGAYIVPLDEVDKDLDHENFGRYAVVYKIMGN